MRFQALPLASALLLTSTAALLAGAGCSRGGGSDVPGARGSASSEQASTSDSDDLAAAKEVVAMLGGGGADGKCNDCHGVTADKIRAWGTTLKAIDDACFGASLTPGQQVDCLRTTPTDPTSAFAPQRLGLYAAGSATDQFKDLFAAAFPSDPTQYTTFRKKAGMPRSDDPPFDNDEFGKIKAWVLRGMPQLDAAFNGDDDDDDAGDAGAENGPDASNQRPIAPR